ncbi:transglycosylase SLT domain-containing protein [Bacillus sp. CMF12]|uniref:transglycosylase SLT domain-containing protein n=1 Tax=Bacillus sp. CMF12 TaxID=2884834 RepID=UPI002079A399|nr:phage tail tape measure protein [Bacillus sp. CMF12]USK48864.1 transglycosylase SLT domain-containing protein [Bacillus sp. CMF12]
MAERIEGLSIGLDLDTLSLDRGLTGLKDRLRTINSEMKLNMSAFDRGERSVEKYQTQLQGLNRKLEVQKQVVTQARAEYQRMVQEHGEGSAEAERAAREYNNQAASLNNLERYIGQVNQGLEELQQEQQNAARGWTRFSNAAQNAKEKLTGIGESMKGVGETMTASLTLPLVGFGALAGKVANDLDSSAGRIEARLGITAERAEKLADIGEDVWKNAFGENVREAGDAITLVSNNLNDIPNEKLKDAAQSAFFLSEAFDADLNESTRAAGQLMKDFEDSSDKAFDVITWGFQNGLDYTGEFLDTIREYSPQFAEMGFTSEQMLNGLKAGFDEGSWSLDKLGDAIKESHLRMGALDKATVEAYTSMGLNAEKYVEKIAKGGEEGNKAFQEIVKKLMQVEDATERNALSTAFFGTQYEDLREKVIFAMAGASKEIANLEGTTKRASDALQDNFGDRATKLWRNFLTDLEPVGQVLIDFGEDLLPKVSDTVGTLTGAFSDFSPEAKKTVLVIGGLVAGIGPLITGLGFTATGVGALAGALPLLAGPVGITAAAVAGLGLGFLALDKEMDKPIIKSDIFKGKISNATKSILGDYTTLMNESASKLDIMAFSNEEITQSHVDNMVTKFQEMTDRILAQLDTQHTKAKEKMLKFFAESDALSKEDEAKILAGMDAQHAEERAKIIANNEEKARILQESKDKHGVITDEANKKIQTLEQQNYEIMISNSVKNAEEQSTILKNLKDQSAVLSAEKAANTVRDSKKETSETIKQAEKKYKDNVAFIEYERDITGSISAEKAAKLISDAERTKNETVTKAQDMHYDVIKEAQAQAGEHADEVNWETGQVLSKWDQMYNGVLKAWNWVRGLFGKVPLSKKGSVKETGRQSQRRQNASLAPGYAIGTPSSGHPGGPAIVGEEGPELAHIPGQGVTLLGMKGAEFHRNLPKGSSVLPNPLTDNLLKSYGFPGYKDGIGDYFDIFLKGAGNVWDLVKNKFNLGDNLFPLWMKNHIGNPMSPIGDMAKSSIKEMWDNWFGDMDSVSSGSGVSRWSGVAAKALMMTGQYTKANLDRLLYQMQTESGGNPRAINLWDINAKRGIPSKGLMQVIDPTFKAYAMPGFNTNIYDPLSNILASIRYAVSRYGSLSKAYRGVGYASGGLINSEGFYQLAEGGWPEWVIPTDPSRRTDAMKLLALAGHEIMGNKRPQQLPNVSGGSNDNSLLKDLLDATLQQNQILMRILQNSGSQGGLDARSLANILYEPMKEIMDFKDNRFSGGRA